MWSKSIDRDNLLIHLTAQEKQKTSQYVNNSNAKWRLMKIVYFALFSVLLVIFVYIFFIFFLCCTNVTHILWIVCYFKWIQAQPRTHSQFIQYFTFFFSSLPYLFSMSLTNKAIVQIKMFNFVKLTRAIVKMFVDRSARIKSSPSERAQ